MIFMFENRLPLYQKLEEERQSKLLVYITGDKPGMETQVAQDTIEYLVDHLDSIGVVRKISLLLHTNGGNTLAAWNIANLIRQFCDDFEVIVPYKALSAGTLMCLAANRIIMTKQAVLGPIDPSVKTLLNPKIDGAGADARFPVSVEAIKGFLDLAKRELAITDNKSLSDILTVLASNVHPLVLGEVYRASGQIKMLAEKLLKHQMTDVTKVKKVISFLCSESGSHDYTINRREARDELELVIEKPSSDLYAILRSIYQDIKEELGLGVKFDGAQLLGDRDNIEYSVKRSLIESISGKTDAFTTEGKLFKVTISGPSPIPQLAIKDQRTFEGWRHYNG
jgi:hypothetical protein